MVPIALLVSSAVGVGTMAIVAVRDPHFATEPDYYQKAIHWDQAQTQAATNRQLGYRLGMPASFSIDARGHALVEVTVSDERGQQLRGVQLVGEAFANAYSDGLVHVVFNESAPGLYQAEVSASHPGLWVFRLVGDRGTEHFTADLRADLSSGGAR